MYDAIVIGGGISGLSTAYQLLKQQKRFIVLEPNHVGGVIRSAQISGFHLEGGPNVLLAKPDLRRLVSELGLDDEIEFPTIPHFQQYVWFNGKPTAIPKSLIALFRSPLLTRREKMKFLCGLIVPGRLRPVDSDESVLTFLGRLAGERCVDQIVDPALKGIYGGEVQMLSARSIFPNLWEHAIAGRTLLSFFLKKKRQPFFVFKGGNEVLTKKMSELIGAEKIVKARAATITPDADGFVIETSHKERYRAKAVYMAANTLGTATLIENFESTCANELKKLRHATLLVVHVSITNGEFAYQDGFGVLFRGTGQSRLLGVMFNSALFPHLVPPGRQLLTLCFGGTASSDICGQSDAAIQEMVRAELREKLTVQNFELLLITRWPDVIPQYEVGHYRFVAELDRIEHKYPGLFFVGSYRAGVGVSDRVSSGVVAAERLM